MIDQTDTDFSPIPLKQASLVPGEEIIQRPVMPEVGRADSHFMPSACGQVVIHEGDIFTRP
jgi:hypothetical protein